MELTPAYGRDYKNKTEVISAFNDNKDFQGDYSIGFALVNREQIQPGTAVSLRYKQNRSVTRYIVPKGQVS